MHARTVYQLEPDSTDFSSIVGCPGWAEGLSPRSKVVKMAFCGGRAERRAEELQRSSHTLLSESQGEGDLNFAHLFPTKESCSKVLGSGQCELSDGGFVKRPIRPVPQSLPDKTASSQID